MSPVGAGIGLVAGSGLALAFAGLPWWRRPSLEDRVAPYLRDEPQPSGLLARGQVAGPLLSRLVTPVLVDLGRRLGRVLGGTWSVQVRLDRAGGHRTVEEFRVQQVYWGAAGLLAGLVTAVTLGARLQVVPLLVLCLLSMSTGVLLRDRWLSREVAQREARLLAELPTVAELLALAVAAGEGAAGALERVTRIGSGELAAELRRALDDVRAGATLVSALETVVARTGVPALARFVDGVAVAVDRGTPLADVLRAQAVDAREAGRRALLEAGGRKEIAMMVPVVFLVLPVTVLFALFPGFYGFSFAG